MYSISSSQNSSKTSPVKLTEENQKEKEEWTKEENKIFENSLAELDFNRVDFFEQIALRLPGKTIDQIKKHYEALVNDIARIDSGEFDSLIMY
ncbi:unnamed protein product [Amaranthus hypochondriacus]